MRADDRLRKRREFQRVYTEGVKVVGRLVVVFVRPGEGVSTRLGITATRKTGSAVTRNRARRRVRELFRRHDELVGDRRLDIVVNVRAGMAAAAWRDVDKDYQECLSRALRRLPRLAL